MSNFTTKRLTICLCVTAGAAMYAYYILKMKNNPRKCIGTQLECLRINADNNDEMIEYYESGKHDETKHNKCLILYPALGRPASDYNELIVKLNNDNYNCYAIQQPGVGLTDFITKDTTHISNHDYASDIMSVISSKNLENEKFHIIGHAFGNRIARTFAMDYPNNVSSCILLACGGGGYKIPETIWNMLMKCYLIILPDWYRLKCIKKVFFSANNNVPRHWIDGYYIRSIYYNGTYAVTNTPFEDFWSGGNVPILVIEGENDIIAPPHETGQKLHNQYGDKRIKRIVLPNAGHALLAEQTDLIYTSIKEFLESLSVHAIED
eukprot:460003_1